MYEILTDSTRGRVQETDLPPAQTYTCKLNLRFDSK